MSPVFAVMRHGMRSWWKDRRSMTLGLLTPLLLYLVFTSVYSGRKPEVPRLDVAWADQDKSLISQHFANLLAGDGTVRLFRKLELPFESKKIAIDSRNVKSLLERGKISLAVVVLPGFGDQVTQFKRLDHAFVRIYYDPTQAMQADMLKGLMTKAGFLLVSENWGESNNPRKPTGNSKLDPHWKKFASLLGQAFHESREFMRSRGNTSIQESFIPISINEVKGSARQNAAAAQQLAGVAVIFLLFSVARAGAVLLDEKQSGTLKRLLSSPLSMNELVVGKLLSISANGFAQISLMCLAGWMLFHVPIFASPAALIAMILATALCAAGFGLFFAAFCQTAEQVQAGATFLILAMSLIGGSMIPKFLLPSWTQKLSAFTLNGWAMEGFLNVLVRGTGFEGIIVPASVLLLMAAAFLGIAFLMFPRRLYE